MEAETKLRGEVTCALIAAAMAGLQAWPGSQSPATSPLWCQLPSLC